MAIDIALSVARAILAGFDKHYRMFRGLSASARGRFERGEWEAGWDANRTRIEMYDRRVAEAVQTIASEFPAARTDEALWPQIKLDYIALLYDHKQPECAETFFNSVACRVLARTYYHNAYLFWRPSLSTEHLSGATPTYRSLYPGYPEPRRLRRVVLELLAGCRLRVPFEDLRRDVRRVERSFADRLVGAELHANFQIQALSSVFFRNKAAYVVGRVVNGNSEQPFVVALGRRDGGALYVDAVLWRREHLATLFSLARAYFMVDMEVPSAYVSFLSALMPEKPRSELYTALGLQKQGKTLFYRDLHEHLAHSTDAFQVAPGTRGMVMLVFTLPSLPYVFKMIRDHFAPPKDTTAERVREKYLMVKYHDRVGRMADTLEYSDVALPVSRFSPALLAEMEREVPSRLLRDGDRLVLRHVYIERRLTPLDVYLRDADEERLRHGLRQYGDALREMAEANIFAGDLLLKNFGVTRQGRVVFYDYDEICYLTDINFRVMPPAPTLDDEMRAEPWFSVGDSDVFPEEFLTFVLSRGRQRELFLEYHGDLTRADTWTAIQARVREGQQREVVPYPTEVRFAGPAVPGTSPPAR